MNDSHPKSPFFCFSLAAIPCRRRSSARITSSRCWVNVLRAGLVDGLARIWSILFSMARSSFTPASIVVAAASSPPNKNDVNPLLELIAFSDADRSLNEFSIVVAMGASCGAVVPGTVVREARLAAATRVSVGGSVADPELRISLSRADRAEMLCSIAVSSSFPDPEDEPVAGLVEVPEDVSVPVLRSLVVVLSVDLELSLPDVTSWETE